MPHHAPVKYYGGFFGVPPLRRRRAKLAVVAVVVVVVVVVCAPLLARALRSRAARRGFPAAGGGRPVLVAAVCPVLGHPPLGGRAGLCSWLPSAPCSAARPPPPPTHPRRGRQNANVRHSYAMMLPFCARFCPSAWCQSAADLVTLWCRCGDAVVTLFALMVRPGSGIPLEWGRMAIRPRVKLARLPTFGIFLCMSQNFCIFASELILNLS